MNALARITEMETALTPLGAEMVGAGASACVPGGFVEGVEFGAALAKATKLHQRSWVIEPRRRLRRARLRARRGRSFSVCREHRDRSHNGATL